MDPVASLGLVGLTRRLVDIDSTTGQEGACGRVLADYLRGRGFAVTEQPVDATRFNVLATLDAPRVTLSTHFDCVPPFFPSRLEGTRLYGRGSCDAKGILASQVEAVEQLRAGGVRDVGMLFVVGEERGSDGAEVANTQAPGDEPFPDQRRADRQPARASPRAASIASGCTRTAAPRIRPTPSWASRRPRS